MDPLEALHRGRARQVAFARAMKETSAALRAEAIARRTPTPVVANTDDGEKRSHDSATE